MEDDIEWHYRPPSQEDLLRALAGWRRTCHEGRLFRAIEGAARADDHVIFLTADLGTLFDPSAATQDAAEPGRR